MARMVPPEFDESNKSEAEKLIYYEIQKGFDDSWIVFHSYSLEGKNKEHKIIDAEIDFLFLHKSYGILILEVKGGQIKCTNGKWLQNNREIKDPYKQALSNKYLIKNHLTKYFNSDPPISIGHCVCFPDTFEQSENLSFGHDQITITGVDIKYLFNSITSIMQMQKKPEYELDKLLFKTVEKALIPIFEYGCSIIDRFNLENRKVFSLTDRQCELLSFISEHKRALVKGCAGSGKTIMAIKKAKYLSSEGKSVLLLCYNKMLAESIALETAGYSSIIATTYHNLCVTELEKSGIEVEPSSDIATYFQKEVPQKFLELIADKPIKYDAVIVDEGQDFIEDYWYTINELVKEDGYYYIFYDPDQNIYKSGLKLPELGTPFVLNKNCRNTKNIFAELKDLVKTEIFIDSEAPDGTEIQTFHCADATQIRNKLSQILHDLTSNQGINENQIVILGTHQLSNTSIGENNKIGKFIIKENCPAGVNIIPYYSCMKYKGLESDIVILLDYQDPRWETKSTKYTAISRARHMLYVFSINK